MARLGLDDNRDAANTLGTLLGVLGADVRTVFNGPDALLSLESFESDLILLDIGMPEMDGYELARAIRRRFAHRRIFLAAVTGWGQEEDRRRTGARRSRPASMSTW
jgi:CheY-like chemotaxis protein